MNCPCCGQKLYSHHITNDETELFGVCENIDCFALHGRWKITWEPTYSVEEIIKEGYQRECNLDHLDRLNTRARVMR
jgi:hypothetical protein